MSTNQKSHQNSQVQKAAKTNKTEQPAKYQLNQQQMLEAPETMRSDDVLAAQQQFGNQVVQRALDKEQRRQALTDEQGYLNSDISDVIQQKRGGGSPLPEAVQKDVDQRFKRNFEDVRLHTDDQADQLSRTINARAFTIGKDIFFKRGVFAPGSSQGHETLMHELTHVVQQSGTKGFSGRLKLGASDSVYEKQAERVGKQHSAAGAMKQGAASGVGVQTLGEEEEELQMQGMEEEEELQMQGLEEEEELQMQGLEEEEELQMQPDVTGIVQRNGDEDILDKDNRLNYKAYSKQVLGAGKIAPGIREQVKMFGGSKWDKPDSELIREDVDRTKPPEKKVEKKDVTGPVQIPKDQPETKKVSDVVPKVPLDPKLTETTDDVEYQSETKEVSDVVPKVPLDPKLTETTDDVEDQQEDIPKAPPLPNLGETKKTNTPLSFADEIKAKSKQMRTNQQRQNLEDLETDRSKKVGERVSEQYLEDNKKKPSWLSRVGSFAKKAGGVASNLGGRFFGSALDTARDQIFGKEEKKEEPKAPTPSPVTVNVGGGGGSDNGSLGMLEKYIKENEQLKMKIADLEKEKK